MKLLYTSLIIFLLCFSSSSYAENGLVIKPSSFSVAETLDRFSSMIKKKGITLFARINHAQNAEKSGLQLLPNEVIIFGKAPLGTPLMLSQPHSAIDLPLKAVAWQDEKGKVWLAYNSPSYIAKRHSIENQQQIIKKMTGALNKFSDFATMAVP